MALFVHLASEKTIRAIRNGGIKPHRNRRFGKWPQSVYALPVTPNFYVSHQWLRELRRSGERTICGVYFRIPDDEMVFIGRYNEEHKNITAAEAAALIRTLGNVEGYEVLIPRKIEKSEIHAVRHLPQVIGWRYQPGSHERPYCGCIMCVGRGTIRGRIKNRAFEDKLASDIREQNALWEAVDD